MTLFLTSIITGFLGAAVGGSIGNAGDFTFIGAFIGFSLPYAIVLQKIFKAICMKDEDKLNKDVSSKPGT